MVDQDPPRPSTPNGSVIRALLTLLVAAIVTVGTATTAHAQAAADAAWTCRASAARVDVANVARVEPVIANGRSVLGQPLDSERCSNADASVAQLALGGLSAEVAFAHTRIDPSDGATRDQVASSDAGIVKLRLQSPDGSFVLTADVLRAQAFAYCVGSTPSATSDSSIVNLNVNGLPVSADSPIELVGDGLNGAPIGGLIRIIVGEVVREGSGEDASLTRRALHVQILPGNGGALLDAVVAEAKVDAHGAVCASAGGGGGTPPGGLPEPPAGGTCPAGSSLESASKLCVIIRPPGPGGECPRGSFKNGRDQCIFIVGPLGDVPQGAMVMPLDELPGFAGSRCRDLRFGRLIAIVGTDGRDRITGTTRSDRIFALGGGDSVSARGAADCVEAGRGADRVAGGRSADYVIGSGGRDKVRGQRGRDRLWGNRGHDRIRGQRRNDRLWGGRGRDRLLGARGSDRIRTGRGRDAVHAGRGSDFVDSSRPRRARFVHCGRGTRDRARINANERMRVRGCERVRVVR
jgi:RTX calcium-binding nonapeptide repeat (4 copies)